MKKANGFLDRIYPAILVFGGTIGLLAAFQLTLEKMTLIKDPAHTLSCDLNPLISCGSVISSQQSSAFGFSNTLLGIIGFSMVLTVGMALFAEASFKKWFWRLFWLGTLGGAVFVHWLIFQTVYRLGALCPYCMVVWSVTMPIFWYTTLYLLRHNLLFTGKLAGHERRVTFIENNHFTLLMLWFLIIIGLIFQHFWYYIETVF